MAGNRVIFHCDCNSFYASVELLTRPELKNVPVAVCGDPSTGTASSLPRTSRQKVRHQTAETVASARRKCPQLTLFAPASRTVPRILRAGERHLCALH